MKNTTFCYLFVVFIMSFFSSMGGTFSDGVIYSQTQFSLAIGGTDNDAAYSIIQTQDGGYVLGGTTTPPGTYNHKMYAVMINSLGSIQWSRIVDQRWATSVTQTVNGGVALSSLTYDIPGVGNGISIIELDNSGAVQWSGLVSSDGNSPTNIKRTIDGGYLLTGSNSKLSPRIYIAKVNSSRSLQWERVIAIGNVDDVNSITETTDGGCAAAGGTTPAFLADYDMYVVKLDSSGNQQWNKAIGGTGNEYAASIIRTMDDGYALAGITWSFGAGNSDMYVVKLDASGNIQWSRTIGGTGSDGAYSIIQTTDGGYVIAGSTMSFGAGNDDVYVVKLNAIGTLLWSRTIGGANSDVAHSIIQTNDGGFAVAGRTLSFGAGNGDMFFIKLDASGNSCGYSTSPASIVTSPASQITTPNSYIVNAFSGVSNPSATSSTGGTVINICLTGIEPSSNGIPDEFRLFQNYPNPFNPVTKISFDIPTASNVSLTVYDSEGKEVKSYNYGNLSAGSYSEFFDGNGLSSGVYFYRIHAGDFSQTNKMILIK